LEVVLADELHQSQKPTVALLSPCGHGNLGDAAIQDAVIQSLRARFPQAAIRGITLKPDDTAERHRIEASAIGSFTIPGGYWVVPRGTSAHAGWAQSALARSGPGSSAAHPPGRALLVRALRAVIVGLLGSGRAWIVREEVRHLLAGFRLVRRLDALIISGGGQLDDFWGGAWGHPYAMFKWTLLARLADVPVAYLSVGVGELSSPLTRWFVKAGMRLAGYRSYRDSESKRRLRAVGFGGDDPVYPDLAFSLTPDLAPPPNPTGARSDIVALSPIAYRDPRVWPRKDQRTYDAYMGKLVAFARWLLAAGYRVHLFTTDSPDEPVVRDLDRLLRTAGGFDPGRLLAVPTPGVSEVLALARQARIVVASRMHGVLLSLLVHTPVLALSYDRKVTSLMAEMGLSRHCADIDTFDDSSLALRFRTLDAGADEVRRSVRDRTRQVGDALERQYEDVYRRHLGLASHGRRSAA
jgi:polysaccharide pyruvyl transferase WcaK-like protein